MYGAGSILKLYVKYGRNLHDTETFGRMDPYVESRTATRKDAGTNPVWNEEVLMDYQMEPELEIRVRDSGHIGSDKLVGEARISVTAVMNSGGSWAGDLQLYRSSNKPAGVLNVHIYLIAPPQPSPPTAPVSHQYPTLAPYPTQEASAPAAPTTPTTQIVMVTASVAPIAPSTQPVMVRASIPSASSPLMAQVVQAPQQTPTVYGQTIPMGQPVTYVTAAQPVYNPPMYVTVAPVIVGPRYGYGPMCGPPPGAFFHGHHHHHRF